MAFIGRAVAPTPISANDVPDLPASKITSGTLADARISSSSVSQHATSFDDNNIVNDLSTLGLRVHTQENLIASNTSSASFDTFQDSSGITNLTNSARDSAEYISSVTTSTSTITLNASNYQTYIDITDNDAQSVRNHSSGSTTDEQHLSTSLSNNVSFHSNSNYQSGQTIANSHEATLLGYLFGSDSDPSTYEVNNNVNSATYRLIFHNMKFKTNVTFKPNGTFSMNFKNGTGNLNDFEMYGVNANFSNSSLGVFSSPSGASSMTVSNSTFYPQLSFRVYHGANNSYMFNALSVAGDITAPSVSATGSFESNAITVSSTSSMGAVITYQDQAGTNTLNTDIILKLSANNGSSYSTATLTALPDFATGIKMAKVNDLSVTAGTQLKYKIEFANQASGSKEARIRGVSLQY